MKPNKFHDLGPVERTVIGTLTERKKWSQVVTPASDLQVAYAHHSGSRTHEHRRNFTVCLVRSFNGAILTACVKRNPNDEQNLRLAEKIAFHRALTEGCWVGA